MNKNNSVELDGSEWEQDGGLSKAGMAAIFYVCIGVVGVCDNLLVLVVLVGTRRLRRKITIMFIINQSLIDLVVSIIMIASASAGSQVPYTGLAGDLYCRLWSTKMCLWGLMVSSTYNLVGLTLERYMGVLHPVWHKFSFTKRKARVILASVWVIGLGFNAGYMIPTAIYQPESHICHIYERWPSDSFRKGFGLIITIVQYFIPLSILIFAYGRIIYALRSGKFNITNPDGNRQNRYLHAQKNTIKTLFVVALSFVLCWSWNQVYYTLMNLGLGNDFASGFYHFTVIAVFLNCCINPFIYVVQYERFQTAMKEMFCRIKGEDYSSQSGRNTAMVSQSNTAAEIHQIHREV